MEKKIGLLPTAGAENHAFGGFHTPPTNAIKVWENATFAKSPGTYCKVMSSAQEDLSSHLRKIPSATSGSNKGVKIVPKALSGAIARHSGDGKFYAMPHNEALVGG